MEKLTINDLPKDVLERMRRAIREDSQMISLKNKHSQYIINRQYAKAVLLKEKMQKIEDRVIREYLDSYEGETENMQSLMSDMSPEDREYINTCTNAIILICDMIETFTMDFNQVLKKYHPDYRLEMYDKIMSVGKEAKSHVKFMSECTDNIYQCSFADSADDITELVRNKARSLIRKVKGKEGNRNNL